MSPQVNIQKNFLEINFCFLYLFLGKIIRKFTGHDSRINTVCYNLDESVLLTGSYDGTLRIWDLKSHNYLPIETLK